MNEHQFVGARWWKFDFHTHTPASADFDDRDGMTPESWLKAFMDQEIDCVAITDHNSGGWIDNLKQKLVELQANKPDWYRPLYLFPGVEISAQGDVHILAIFDCDKDESHIDRLLGAVDYPGTKGESDAVTDKSITEVVDEIAKRDGIPIPAHADRKKGVLSQLQGATLGQVLDNRYTYAMELCDSSYPKPQLYTEKKVQWAEVNGSDTHSFSDDGFGTFTWIKMDEPSIDGLELALRDGTASVNRDMSTIPNLPPEYFVEKLIVYRAKYIGRSKPLNCEFSPFLNAIIGGRGSGKSTLLEFMRLVLQRCEDMPKTLQEESRQYFNVEEEDSLLIEDSKISLIYRKGEVWYRLNWSKADCPSLEEKKDDTWIACPGEIKSLFPIRIYSQKQIFELAKNPRALIGVIDEAPEVDAETIEAQRRKSVNQYKQIESTQRELKEKIVQENRLLGEHHDLTRQIEEIEKSAHETVLQNYRKREQQLNELDSLEGKWEEMSRQLVKTRDAIAPADFNKQHFSEHPDILSLLEATNESWQTILNKASELVQEAESVIDDWHTKKNGADWMRTLKADMEQYESLSIELKQQGIDPSKYRQLLIQQKNIQKELEQTSEYQLREKELETEKQEVLKQIEENRKMLSEKRQEFLISVLQDNQAVSIEVKPFGEDWEGIEEELRGILQCHDRFDRDIDNLKDIYQRTGGNRIEKLKETIKCILNGEENAKDVRFATHLKSLPQESVTDLILWFPGDDLKVTFGPNRQPIEQGSPGQKTAALLAFILCYGDEPLLLDQPEDDLDNELIYHLIVERLRETKNKRQVIVVTHNANIVVNGDAEMVLPLKVECGETRVLQAASIQEKKIRQAICDILEGGQQAFEQRYKRIHLGN